MPDYDVGVEVSEAQREADELAEGLANDLTGVYMRKRACDWACDRCKRTIQKGRLAYHIVEQLDGTYVSVLCRDCWDTLRELMPPDLQV